MRLNRFATRIAVIPLVVLALVLTWATPGLAVATARSSAPVQLFGSTTIVPEARSSLIRTGRGISMSLHTFGLPPSSADTVWWVVFNAPQNCTHPEAGNRCGSDDIFSNPDAKPSVLYVAGHLVGRKGKGTFLGHLRRGDTSGCVPAAVPPHFPCNAGLTNPMGADVLLVVRTHGNAIPGRVEQQISTFDGGCETNTCANVQASYHKAKT